jgi:hypothetical protein
MARSADRCLSASFWQPWTKRSNLSLVVAKLGANWGPICELLCTAMIGFKSPLAMFPSHSSTSRHLLFLKNLALIHPSLMFRSFNL